MKQLPFVFISLAAVVAVFGISPVMPEVVNQDHEALAELYEDYRKAWLRNDEGTEAAVLSLFSSDSTIIPSGGRQAYTGIDEMRNFWFPKDTPPGNVDLFEQQPLKISAGDNHGYVLGRFKLRFSYPDERYYTEGYNLFSAVRENGVWKISTMMWTHPAWEVEKNKK